jgi:tRNA pseudouridine32 synthase/23S rRNA pseudouridine746 synthase
MPDPVYENSAFSTFGNSAEIKALARGLTLSLDNVTPHPLCLLAVSELQLYLRDQQEWNHSFECYRVQKE